MDDLFKFLTETSWRDGVLLIVVILTIYFVVLVLRLSRIRRTRPDAFGRAAPEIRTPPPEFDAPAGSVLAGVWDSPAEPGLVVTPNLSRNGRVDTRIENHADVSSQAAAASAPELAPIFSPAKPETLEKLRADTAPKSVAAHAQANADFAQQLAFKTLENELTVMRNQLAAARGEIEQLRSEMEQVQASQTVSPLYNEAMSLAVRGVDAAGVAGRCGISIAEAELVVALSRKSDMTSPADYEPIEEEDHYGRDGKFRARY